ncbi:MAG: hypothetical protein ABI972_28105 [Acidobacteriota bacterium]
MNPWKDPELRLRREEAKRGIPSPEPGLVGTFLIVAAPFLQILFIAAVIFAGMDTSTQLLRDALVSITDPHVRAVRATAFAALAAGVLYKMRRLRLMEYGIIEVAFGLASTAWTSTTIDNTKSRIDVLVILAGCVYLLVRGLDNFFRGKAEREAAQFAAITQQKQATTS